PDNATPGTAPGCCGHFLHGRDPYSIGPVFHSQSWNLPKMSQVARDQRCLVRQRNAGNQQVAPADLLNSLVLPQAIELCGGTVIQDKNRERREVALGYIESFLALEQPLTVFCLDYRGEPAFQYFNASNDCGNDQ